MTHLDRLDRAPALLAALFLSGLAPTLLAQAPAQESEAASGAALATASETADPVVADLIELGRSDNRAQEHLRALCFDMGPRLTASHGLQKAQEWAVAQFTEWGADARIEEWGEFPVGFDRGPWSGRMVAPEELELEFITMAWTAGTDGPVRARAVLYPTNEEGLEAVRDQLPGAWLVRERSTRRGRGRRGADPQADPVAEAVAAAGIAGIVRSSGSELLRTGGSYRVDWEDLPTKVEVVLRGDMHTDLIERLKADEEVELEFSIDNRFFEGPVTQHNVVADIKGTEKPDEYVIVCGHLDSWDGAQGTVDNGTGVSTTMEAARLLLAAGARPERTIRFILWSGEEQGLLGSKGYVERNADIMERISAVLNHDGGTNYLSGLTITHAMEPQMQEALEPLIGLSEDFAFELRTADGLSQMGSSDHASFVRAGAPGFFWNQAGRSKYNHMHHTQYDTFETAVPEYQQHSALVAAIAAYRIANLDELLDRTNMIVEPLAPRRMGVQLEDVTVTAVLEGKAKEAGWKNGDVILAVDGATVATRNDIVRKLQDGGPRKVFSLKRGEETVESVLDYSNDPDEERRAARQAKREADRAKRRQRERE